MSSLKFLADENFESAILRGLFRRDPSLNIVRVQDVGLIGREDPEILIWAEKHEAVLLTHDYRTMPAYGYEHIAMGNILSGMIVMRANINFRTAIDDTLLIAYTSTPSEFANQIVFLPL